MPTRQQIYYIENREKVLEYKKQYQQANQEKIKTRKRRYYLENTEEIKERDKERYDRDRDKISLQKKEYYSLVGRRLKETKRMILFRRLGGKCSNPDCLVLGGCTDVRCIQIDHINGGGVIDIKRFGNADRMIRYYIEHEDEANEKLQLLCANCNWIKRHENKEFGNRFKTLFK